MALNKREKTLAAVTAPLILIAGWVLFSAWWGPLAGLRTQRDDLAAKIEKDQERVRRSRKTQARLDQWNRRSLPSDPEIAASVYSSWVFRLAKEAGFRGTKVEVTTGSRQRAGVYRPLGFSVTAEATLDKLTEFLHRFRAASHLHRIRSLTIHPAQSSKELDLTFVVEALSLPDAQTVTVDVTEGSFDTVANFTPDLKPERVYTGSDGKLADRAKFRLAGIRGAVDFSFQKHLPLEQVREAINEKTRQTGVVATVDGDQLYLQCETIDSQAPPDGLAASELDAYRRTITERNLFAEYKPPPPVKPAPPKPPEPPKFDPCKYAYLTGIVAVNRQPEAWLIARTTGEEFRLREGDSFDLGDIRAKVIRINRRDAEIEFDGKRWLLPMGDNLRDAKPLFDAADQEESGQ